MAPKTDDTKAKQEPAQEKKNSTDGVVSDGMSDKQKAEAVDGLCRELKIDPQYVFASSVDEKLQQITIVTMGGTRVRVRPGDDLPELTEVQITGISPKKKRVLAGKARGDKE